MGYRNCWALHHDGFLRGVAWGWEFGVRNERLVERGLVQAHGIKKGRTYTLSPAVYRTLGQAADYIRQAGFDPLQQEQMVLSYVERHGKIRRQDVTELCRLSPDQATRLLQRLVKAGQLLCAGTQKGAFYERPQEI